jgi:hypothetical protein
MDEQSKDEADKLLQPQRWWFVAIKQRNCNMFIIRSPISIYFIAVQNESGKKVGGCCENMKQIYFHHWKGVVVAI